MGWGGISDVLVNNAGYGQSAPFEQMSAQDFQAVVDTCFYGVVFTIRGQGTRSARAPEAVSLYKCATSSPRARPNARSSRS